LRKPLNFASSSMASEETKLECLRLAVEFGSVHNIKDPIALADTYLSWVTKSGDKQSAPRRKPLSKAA